MGGGIKEMANKSTMGKGTVAIIVIMAAVLALAFGYIMFGGSTPPQCPKGYGWSDGACNPLAAPAPTPLPGTNYIPPASVVSAPIHLGTISLQLQNANSGLAGASILYLLDSKYAKYNADGTFDARSTKLSLMNTIGQYSITSLTAFGGGSPLGISESGSPLAWSTTGNAKQGQQALALTYVDTTPGAGENASSVQLLTFQTFSEGTSEWTVTTSTGATTWNIPDYATYGWIDGTGATKINYTIGDGGTVATSQPATWYTNSSNVGEECVDCGIFMIAPTNYTTKFKGLAITAYAMKPNAPAGSPQTVQFLNMPLAQNDPVVGITSQVLPSPALNQNIYFLGYLPSYFETTRTSTNKNQLTWMLTTDTYGGSSPQTVTFYIIQNVHALSTTNGAFQVANGFPFQFSSGADTGFDIAP